MSPPRLSGATWEVRQGACGTARSARLGRRRGAAARQPCRQAAPQFRRLVGMGNREWTRMDPTRPASQPQPMDCGGKRSATPLSDADWPWD